MGRCLILFAALISALLGSSVAAQESPGPQHRELQKLVGNWNVHWTMAGQLYTGTAVYRSVSGGMWVASDVNFKLGDAPFVGHGMDGYDAQKKKYVSLWTDSMRTGYVELLGDVDDKSGSIVMSGNSRGYDGGEEKLKSVTEFKDADHFTFSMYVIQPTGGENKLFSMEYVREGK